MIDKGGEVHLDEALPRCCASGHESVPAAAIGILDDGDEAEADVPYCGECARALITTGDYRVTRVIDPIELGNATCRRCGGSGRDIARNGDAAVQIAAGRTAVQQVRQLVADFEDVPPSQMTPLFYAHAYWELRLSIDELLNLLQPGRAGSATTEENP